ncbi:hypothetical protein AB1N83_009625 [Pleurotus pulmonarius]
MVLGIWQGAHASRHLHQILQDRPQVQRVRFFADNTSAISIDKLLSDRQDIIIGVSWSPGHSGIRGNERADQLAKRAATQRSFIGTTVAWAKARTKATALEHWVQEWKELPKNSPSSLSLTRPPSTRPCWVTPSLGSISPDSFHGCTQPVHVMTLCSKLELTSW